MSHRRARHLNAKCAGASLVLDARRITGLNDSDPVGTWSDVSGNSYNATQSTSGKKPTYKVNIQGGQPGVLYSGGQVLSCGDVCNVLLNGPTIIVVGKANSSSANKMFLSKALEAAAQGRYSIFSDASNNAAMFFTGYLSLDTTTSTAAATTKTSVYSGVVSRSAGTVVARLNEAAGSTATFAASPTSSLSNPYRLTIGAYNNSTDTGEVSYLNGYIHYACIILGTPNNPMRKRHSHAAAFSFKIACS